MNDVINENKREEVDSRILAKALDICAEDVEKLSIRGMLISALLAKINDLKSDDLRRPHMYRGMVQG